MVHRDAEAAVHQRRFFRSDDEIHHDAELIFGVCLFHDVVQTVAEFLFLIHIEHTHYLINMEILSKAERPLLAAPCVSYDQ